MRRNAAKEAPKKRGVLSIFCRLAPSVVRAAPVMFFSSILLSILHGVSHGLDTVIQQYFFDEAVLLSSGNTTWTKVLLGLAMMGGVNILTQVLNGVSNYIPNIQMRKVNGRLSIGIHRKMARLSPVVFESTEKLDDINKAEQGKNNSMWFVTIFCTIFTFYLPYFLFMGWYLFTLKPILVLSIVLVFIPTAATQLIRTKVFANLEDKSAPIRREQDYCESCIVGRETFKETRLLGGFSYFKSRFLELLQTLQKLQLRAALKSDLAECGMRLLSIGGYFGILLLLFDALISKEITVGAFAAVFNSIGMLYSVMEEVVCFHIKNLAKDMGTIRNYLNFLDLEERPGSLDTAPGWGDITLENVTLTYPQTDKPAVQDVSLALKKGETLAVVGENGSGKSTLIRLLTGLYPPDSGKVRINGTPASDLTFRALFAGVSAVFQRYQRYQMTLSDNIAISDTDETPDDSRLDAVAEMAGVDKDDRSFTDGYQTMLSREFDGVDLSGGQWQRVAIARGFFRRHHTIILDEPTAAIDPYEETRIYNRFAEISKDKSAVIVTHRLGSVKLADRIAVMKDGRLVQLGTHDVLIAEEGEYRRLYTAQEQWYQEEIPDSVPSS